MRYTACLGFTLLLAACTGSSSPAKPDPVFTLREVMIPVRDGVHLQTAILTPVNQSGPLPILFRRTPYGVPDKAPDSVPGNLRELAKEWVHLRCAEPTRALQVGGRIQGVL